jgi:hypothetical protein
MGGEVAGDGDEDMATLAGVAPLIELAHTGFQHLIGVEPRVLPQQRPRQSGDQWLRRMTKREMACYETCGAVDLPLPVEGIEQGDAERLGIGGQIVEPVVPVSDSLSTCPLDG